MLASELDYDLPEERIAQHPLPERDASRLLVVPRVRGDAEVQATADRRIVDWAELVPERALVVLNDTRVMKARVFAQRLTGGKVELLFLSEQRDGSGQWQVLLRANRRLPVGDVLQLGDAQLEVGGSTEAGTRLVRSSQPIVELLEKHGHVPLPPYVRRADDANDEERYQTVFAQHFGSAAAPTAGLHVTQAMLERLRARGVELGFVTLHVGAGTFRPVSVERLEQHPMHSERYDVSADLAGQLQRAKAENRPVIAVGTTVVRALESAAREGVAASGSFDTQLLISPGYRFQIVDALLTNFHAPRSTLLALAFAFAGTAQIRAAYATAIARGYRFLSYGDAMWIPPHSS